MKIKKRFGKKIFSLFSTLILLINSFIPYLPLATVYSQEPLQSSITFDSGNNSFKISVNTSDSLTYLLVYKTPGNIEGTAPTTVEKSDSYFSKEIYAGIKSGNDSRKDEVVRGIYKVKVDSQNWFNEKRFIFENGSLKVVDDSTNGSLDVSTEDSNWLETGTDTIEQVCVDNQTLINNTYIDWNINVDEKTAETKGKVQLGVTYVFPFENKVTLKFNCLPKNEALRTTLKIQQIKVSDLNLPDSVNPATEYAYDITTAMKDASFKYEVTLPKLNSQDAKVSYIEKTVDEVKNQTVAEEDIKPIEENKTTQETDTVKIAELDHFTIFFVIGGEDTTLTSHILNVGDISELSASDDNRYGSDCMWPIHSYDEDRYIQFNFNPNLPVGSIINGANIIFEYQRSRRAFIGYYGAKLEVCNQNCTDDSNWHNLPDDLRVPKNPGHIYPFEDRPYDETFTINIPANYVDTIDKVNNLKLRFLTYGRMPLSLCGIITRHDYVALNIDYAATGSISGHKWEDINANGAWDLGEPALSGWEIFIDTNKNYQYDAGEPNTITDANGYYEFSVAPGEHWVFETQQAGWSQQAPYYTQGHSYFIINAVAGQTYSDNNFGNYRWAHIEGDKWNDLNGNGIWDSGEPSLFLNGLRYRIYKEYSPGFYGEVINGPFESSHYGEYVWVAPGTYWVAEYNAPSGWTQTYPDVSAPTNFGMRLLGPITLLSGESSSGNNLGNTQNGNVIVTKYHDLNQNGIKDENELVLSNWDINLDTLTATTSAQGEVDFENLVSGDYTLSENIKSGWRQTNISCGEESEIDNDNSHTVTVNPGQTTNCEIGNYRIPHFSIAKFNNKWPLNGAFGGEVVFTLLLSIFDNDIKDLHVMDLLPAGFTFKPGTAKMDGFMMTTQPEYHSPGDWQIGDVSDGQDIILEYTATIDSNQEPGLYKDLAYAYGCEYTTEGCSVDSSDAVLAQSVDSGQVDPGVITDNFVGTKVNLAKEQQESSSVNVVKEETKEQGEVLGASTGLPGTGGKTIWMIISSILSLLGLIILAFGIALKTKKMKFIAKLFTIIFILFGFLMLGKTNAFAATFNPLSIRLEQPQSPTRLNEFKLNFVTMDMLGESITVKCFKDAVQFGSDIAVTAGGNTGSCQVDSSIISSKGTYSFYVTAQTASNNALSETVTVDYNTEGPGTPTNYSKEHPSSCQYKIKFRTADDSDKTVKVEVYRSLNTSFNLDSGNRVFSISIGSNTDYSYTDNVPSDCDKEWYYAVRAFDAYGNGSGSVGDSVITVTYTTTSSTSTTGGAAPTSGAIPVVNITLPSAEEVLGAKTTPSPTSTEKQKEEVVENVLGTSAKKENRNLIIGIGIGLLTLAIIGYAIYKKKKSQEKI